MSVHQTDCDSDLKTCDNCGNRYDKTFEVIMRGESYHFDAFECAINKLAPSCEHCDSKIIGHGIEACGRMFCCAHCAEEEGIDEAVDRVRPDGAQ